MALAMTEHSICHPGRPGPQGEAHEGSPGFEAFHKAKSDADLRPAVAVDNAPDGVAGKRMSEAGSVCPKSKHTFAFLEQLPIAFTPWLQLRVDVTFGSVKCPRVKVYASANFVRVSVLDDALDEGDNLRDVFRHTGDRVWLAHAQAGHVIEELGLPVRRQRSRNGRICDGRAELRWQWA
jgi:hypothetical protein